MKSKTISPRRRLRQQFTLDRWGPNLWRAMHAITFAYPKRPRERHRRAVRRFLGSLPDLLPCRNCGDHFRRELRRFPLRAHSRKALSRWMVDVHNRVNARLRKPIITYREAEEIYSAPASFHENDNEKENEEEDKVKGLHRSTVIALSAGGGVLLLIIAVAVGLWFARRRRSQKS